MGILAKVGAALLRVFGVSADEAAQASDVIQRQRKFTPRSLARTFILGFLQKPDASDEDLAQMAASCGAAVTPQAIEQRHTPQMVKFLEQLFRQATQIVVGSAMKLQTELDLRSGALLHVEIEPGRSPDNATCRQHVARGAGTLRITDLGYFDGAVFADMLQQGEHFLSRLQFGTGVSLANGQEVKVLDWLAQQAGPFVDQPILMGKKQQLACRLIAWRVPEEQANRRRQKLRQETLRKRGQEPSAQRLAWCDWTILVTSVPVELLTPAEAVILYRARWQIELLFKRWKAQDLVAVLSGSTEVRQMVRVWSRLLAALVQHWLVVGSAWGDPTKSLSKVCEATRKFVGQLVATLDGGAALERVLANLCQAVAKTCRRNKRSKPGTFELLNDVTLLEFTLT
jgi:hypothetical protein